tara:strand:- start:70 stop:345 length:276 start_codon:yes stop_codon:yes gene_type:complete
MKNKIIEAILAINSNAQVSVSGEDINSIVWENGTTPISKSDIEQKINEKDYIYKRASEYPSIVDQLDDIYHNDIEGWKTTIKAVKDKYPKE